MTCENFGRYLGFFALFAASPLAAQVVRAALQGDTVAVVACSTSTVADGDDLPSEDGTTARRGGDEDSDGTESPSEDDTPDAGESPEPNFGGCLFEKKPLELMV